MTPLRFLAVDDDPVFSLVLKGSMLSIGHSDVQTLASASAALTYLQTDSAQVDCFLLDIEMPGMNGIELCRHIRTIARFRATPIIMITSLSSRQSVDEAFLAGATDYLTKPVDMIELKARVGMMSRLVSERRRTTALQDELQSWADLPRVNLDFDEPAKLAAVNGMIDYLALENHLLTVGFLRLYDITALAFQVVNARSVFLHLDRLTYLDYLADVGSVISDNMKLQQFLMAHAGRGEFICVTERSAPIDQRELERKIAHDMEDFSTIYGELRLPLPMVRVGQPQATGLFTSHSASRLLNRARASIWSDDVPARSRVAN